MTDKSSIQQVLGSLMKRPQFLSEIDKYVLLISDFSTRFEKYIYGAIYGLYQQGATHIEPIDIANFLESDVTAKKTFEVNNGIEYLQDILEFSSIENFPYYYNRLKKINLLRDLKKQGFDITDFYDEDLTSARADEVNARFEELSLKDICDGIKKKVLGLEAEYVKTGEVEVRSAAEGMRDFIKEMNETISIGPAVQGAIYNQIIGGAEKGALTIRSAPSSVGKAIPNSERIPTPDGWKTIGDIRAGDYVFDAFGKPTKVLQIFPQGIKDVWMVTFKSGRVARCCDEHLWSYYDKARSKELLTKTLKEIVQEGKQAGYKRFGKYCYRIPTVGVIQLPEKNYSTDPFVKGFLLGKSGCAIPEEYLFGSESQRLELLRGLVAASGLSKKRHISFTTKSSLLKTDFIGLVASLGMLPRLSVEHKRNGETVYCIDLVVPSYRKKGVFYLEDKLTKPRRHQTERFETDPIVKIEKLDYQEEMTCFMVDNIEHLFVAGDTWWVTHNTRLSVADACYLAYPVRYDGWEKKWVQRGSCEKVLFVITEQTFPQINKMILAYLSDINESRFKLGNFSEEEEERLNRAVDIMENFSSNFTIIKIPAPSIELTKTMIREQCLTKDISCVFFDYIFINPELLREFKGSSLRNDELLLLFSTALKDLAVELNVAMFTSTQVNAAADDNKNIRNESALAGGRSTINKADNGVIMARPTNEELETLQPLIERFGAPNIVSDVFKVRSGEWTQVRIWSQVNLGTMKRKDLFLTDSRLEPIEGFFEESWYEVQDWSEQEQNEVVALLEKLNERKGSVEL